MNAKAREIILRAKKDVFSGNLGNNLTTFNGDGMDFKEIHEYSFGDDIKKINWKATAKSNNIKVNVFNNEQQLNILVAFLVSGSIRFGSVKLKQDVMAEILALISFSAIKKHDSLSNVLFSSSVKEFYPAFKNEHLLQEVVTKCLEEECLGEDVDFDNFCTFVNSRIKKKSLIFLIGDFYSPIDLSNISHKNEIFSIIVRDRLEEYPMLNGQYSLTDPMTMQGESADINKSVAKKYQKLIQEHDKNLISHFEQHGIKHGKIYTNEDIYLRLSQIIKG